MLVAGIVWVAASLLILQFSDASVTTVGILVGIMFAAAGIQNIALATLDVPLRWAWALFGGLFLASAIVCPAHPTTTFAGLAEMLGFLFLVVGVWWIVREKADVLLVFAGIWALMQGITSIVRAWLTSTNRNNCRVNRSPSG